MALKSYEKQSRDIDWSFEGIPTLEQLKYGATARIASALESLNTILRNESGWCGIRRNLDRLVRVAERPTVTVRHVFRVQFKVDLPWLKGKKRKK